MFTPPPSPLPPQLEMNAGETPFPEPSPQEIKHRIATRTKLGILLVPAILMIITLSTRYITHPAFFDSLSGAPGERLFDSDQSTWNLHRRHPGNPATSTVAISQTIPPSLAASSTATTNPPLSTSIPAPTIPTNPVLPTPFPQPFDTTISENFSTISCLNFFSNMTAALDFRECRSFGLLSQTSSAFLNAQGNITLLNDLVWGTCNTNLDLSQCLSNMNWFADSLRSACATELSNNNVLVVDALAGLLTYSLMYDIGCMDNPSTSVYCYISAVANTSNPSDLYYYQLPFGISVPNNTSPSCSPCIKNIMSLYMSVIKGTDPNTTDSSIRSVLSHTYGGASQLAVQACGNEYVQTTTVVSGGVRSRAMFTNTWSIFAGVMIGFVTIYMV